MMAKSSSSCGWWRAPVRWALVLWAAALVFYFEMKEGLVRWPWLFKSADGGVFRENGLPDIRPERPFMADAHEAPYVSIFKNLFAPWDVNWANAPWAALGIAAAMVLAYTALGWLMLGAFRVFMPRLARACLALVLGSAAVGVAGEALGMANRLTQPWVVAMWAGLWLLAGGMWWIGFRRRNRPHEISADTCLTYGEQQKRARDWFAYRWPWPQRAGAWVLMGAYVLLFALISFFLLLHAVGEPVSYWDSLILYVGYARAMYLEGGFPVKIVGQVGIGLGANYPHLYEVLTAQTAALAGYWNDSFAQLLPPVATTAALVLVYYIVLELTDDRPAALACAVLTRAVPYGLSYSQFASNYSVAILYTAAFLYLAVRLVKDGLGGYRVLMFVVAGAAVHINYLMWGLFPVGVLAVVMAHWRYRPLDASHPLWQQAEPGTPLPVYPPEFMHAKQRPGVLSLLGSGRFWLMVLVVTTIAVPWYVRNTMLTGNPVYAFYSNVFPSINVNPDVMKSAEREWKLNGDGLANVGSTLGEKLRGSWLYFVTGQQHWKLSPMLMALVMPGFVLWALWWMGRVALARRRASAGRLIMQPDGQVFRAWGVMAALFVLLWFYAYVVADFYLYQIIIVLPLFGVFAAVIFCYCRGARGALAVLHALVLLMAVAPGLAMAVMGFKLKKTGVYEHLPPPQFAVTALRKLFMEPRVYYRMEYGGDMEMIDRVNKLPEGTAILTHENRHLLLRPDLRIVHLDDWEPQQVYGKPAAERVAALDELGVSYYWYVPNESKHLANSWLGMEELIDAGYYERVADTASPDAGNADYPLELIPRDRNVLFRRTESAGE